LELKCAVEHVNHTFRHPTVDEIFIIYYHKGSIKYVGFSRLCNLRWCLSC